MIIYIFFFSLLEISIRTIRSCYVMKTQVYKNVEQKKTLESFTNQINSRVNFKVSYQTLINKIYNQNMCYLF